MPPAANKPFGAFLAGAAKCFVYFFKIKFILSILSFYFQFLYLKVGFLDLDKNFKASKNSNSFSSKRPISCVKDLVLLYVL